MAGGVSVKRRKWFKSKAERNANELFYTIYRQAQRDRLQADSERNATENAVSPETATARNNAESGVKDG